MNSNQLKLFGEQFEVWQYGPVISSVYQVFKRFGSNKIAEYYFNVDGTYSTVKFRENKRFDDAFENVVL